MQAISVPRRKSMRYSGHVASVGIAALSAPASMAVRIKIANAGSDEEGAGAGAGSGAELFMATHADKGRIST